MFKLFSCCILSLCNLIFYLYNSVLSFNSLIYFHLVFLSSFCFKLSSFKYFPIPKYFRLHVVYIIFWFPHRNNNFYKNLPFCIFLIFFLANSLILFSLFPQYFIQSNKSFYILRAIYILLNTKIHIPCKSPFYFNILLFFMLLLSL